MEQQLFIAFITSAALLWLLAHSIEKPDTALKTLWLHFRQWSLPLKTAVILCLCLMLLYGGTKPPPPEIPASVPPIPALVITEPLPLDPPALATTNRLTESQCAAGFALVSVNSNTAAWSVPTNAALYPRWMRYGVAEDIFWQPATNWGFVIGTNAVEGAHLSSSGLLSFNKPISTSQPNLLTNFVNLSLLSPLHGSFGIVPPTGHFWQAPTPSNTMLFTWESVYAARDTNAPLSFQTELFANGDFTYRYDFTQLPTNYWPLLTNYTISAQHNGGGEAYRLEGATNLPERLELKWRAFGELDSTLADNDGDGLTDYEEIFIYGTDPTMPDTDLDGLSDYDEIMLGTNPLLRDTDGDGLVDGSDPDPLAATDLTDNDNDGLPDAWKEHFFGNLNIAWPNADHNGDGFINRIAILTGINPTNAVPPDFVITNQALPYGLDVWEISPAFALEAGNDISKILDRAFPLEHVSPWQQFYISSKPDRTAGWHIEGMKLNWSVGDDKRQSSHSPGASLHLQTSNQSLHTAYFSLEATTTTGLLRLPTPLYLIRWTPQLSIEPTQDVYRVTHTNGASHIATKYNLELPFEIDFTARPHKAPLTNFEFTQLLLQPLQEEDVTFNINLPPEPIIPPEPLDPAATCEVTLPIEGFIIAHKPTKFEFPNGSTNLPSKLLFLNLESVFDSGSGLPPDKTQFPLDDPILRSRWHANAVAEGSVEEPKLNVLMGIEDKSLACYVNGALQDSNSQGAPKPNMMPTMAKTSTDIDCDEVVIYGSSEESVGKSAYFDND